MYPQIHSVDSELVFQLGAALLAGDVCFTSFWRQPIVVLHQGPKFETNMCIADKKSNEKVGTEDQVDPQNLLLKIINRSSHIPSSN